MMKRLLSVFLFIAVACYSYSQGEEDVFNFINKYNCTGKDHQEMIGKPLPAFSFNKRLNSKALKGKYLILDYWASWCVPCRLLVKDIDSLLVRSADFDQSVQVIGVDCGERNVAAAHSFWQKGNFAFPMVDGPKAEEFGKKTFASHPDVLLVDDKGIIRLRLDSYIKWHAHFLKLAIFALKTVPEKHLQISMSDIEKMMNAGEYPMALYYLEKQPEDLKVACMKFKCYLLVSEWNAKLYYDEMKKKYEGQPQYAEFIYSVAQSVYESNSDYLYILKIGYDAADSYLMAQSGNVKLPSSFWAINSIIQWRFSNSLKAMAKSTLNSVESDKLDAVMQEEINKLKVEMNKAD